jgi:pyruvate/2-oxoglutarate dehydrogenase complex dihydrolipoamide dehydrogenase (E3) component
MTARPLHEQADVTDPADRRLLALVHPSGWPLPSPGRPYQLVVIGGGTAGLVSAAGAAGLGARVALVERHLMGGDCLVTGCVPSKALIHAAASGGPRGDGAVRSRADRFDAALQRLRALRADIGVNDSAERFRGLGVDVYFGSARFVSPREVAVGERRLRFRRAVIATGSAPRIPSIPGLDASGFLTSESVFELREQPASLVVLGGGPIGCELSQAFARLGTIVTLLSRSSRLLPRDEPDASHIVASALARDGVRIRTGATVQRVERRDGLTCVHLDDGDAIETDALLVATGREPRTADLGLAAAGVAFDADGVRVNDRMQTSNPRIFAAGDVASAHKFTHAADALARLVVQNALFFGRARASGLIVPHATYTSPEVAQVGPTVEAARARGLAVDVLRIPLAHVDRAVIDEESEGFLQLLIAPASGRIVGGTIVAARAGDLCGELSLAVTSGLRIGALGAAIHPYPTTAEAFRKAADAHRRGRLTPVVRRLFGLWFRWF